MKQRTSLRVPAVIFGIVAFAILFACGCATMKSVGNTITTSFKGVVSGFQEVKEAKQLNEADEDELGKAVAILLTNTYAPSDNQRQIAYVNLVGFTLVAASSAPDRHYVFGVLDTDDIGAYSGPNGYIMITRGALQSMRDEGELAGVLAHELGHVINHHGLKAARNAAEKAGYMDAAKSVLPSEDATKFIDTGIDAVVRNGYDKPQETEADLFGVKLMIAAGYDPASYAKFLSHIAAMQLAVPRSSPQTNESSATIKQVMATHPDVAERYQAVMNEIEKAGNPGGATMKERFKRYMAR